MKTNLTQKDIDNFWRKADKTASCWIWRAAKSSDGYGKFSLKRGKKTFTFRAHRLSFFLTFERLSDSVLICHSCDNPLCVNPLHLFEGSVLDNAHDMIAKGRENRAKGEKLSSLTEQDVSSIRERVKNGEKQIHLARELKLGKNQIWHIVNRTTWKHL